ncbi:hypothetical protein CWB79_17955 [Pseudoalteromonas sp. S1649]|nr:hypothetical protein CWB80_18560 [Pseudoalteromonas sp. S1650]TMP65056.1 hypothetical protein CWB79_17955 [Pseudoalteromonas sp. S1649]
MPLQSLKNPKNTFLNNLVNSKICLQLTAYSLQLTAYSLQLTAYSLQLTAYSLQLTAYSLQLVLNLTLNRRDNTSSATMISVFA